MPFLRYNLSTLTNSKGVSITPIHDPLTNTFDEFTNCSGSHSKIKRNAVFERIHLIIG